MKMNQQVYKISFKNALDVGKERDDDLKRFIGLISEAKTIEEACNLILSIPKAAFNRGPHHDDFYNGFYCLADLTQSEEKEVALCAAWAAIGMDFYNVLSQGRLPYGHNWKDWTFINWEWVDRALYDEAIDKLLIFLGRIEQDIHPKRKHEPFDLTLTKDLIQTEKFEKAAKDFLRLKSNLGMAGKGLLRFCLFEEIGKGMNFGIIHDLEEYICRQPDGSWKSLEEVEGSDSKSHACSALRRLLSKRKSFGPLIVRERAKTKAQAC